MNRTRWSKQPKGFVLVLTAVGMVTLIGMIGLAIDSGMAYGVRAKLNTALDAAGVAAARAVSQGASQGEQISNAVAAAQKFFAANFPTGYLGATPVFNDPQIQFNDGEITIDVSGSANRENTFMQVMGFDDITVNGAAQVIRKDLDLSFVIDTTGSMSGVGERVKDAAQGFVRKFSPSTDRMALIHYASGAEVDEPVETVDRGHDRDAIIADIETYSFTGHTNFAEGFWNARDQLNSIDPVNRSTLRVIVFFADGSPNTFASSFVFPGEGNQSYGGSIRSGGDGSTGSPRGLYRYDRTNQAAPSPFWKNFSIPSEVAGVPQFYNPHDITENEFLNVNPAHPRRPTNNTVNFANLNRISRNLAEDMATTARNEGIFVFTLGLGFRLQTPAGPDGEIGEPILKRMANVDDADTYDPDQPRGEYCFAATDAELEPCFERLAGAILRLSL